VVQTVGVGLLGVCFPVAGLRWVWVCWLVGQCLVWRSHLPSSPAGGHRWGGQWPVDSLLSPAGVVAQLYPAFERGKKYYGDGERKGFETPLLDTLVLLRRIFQLEQASFEPRGLLYTLPLSRIGLCGYTWLSICCGSKYGLESAPGIPLAVYLNSSVSRLKLKATMTNILGTGEKRSGPESETSGSLAEGCESTRNKVSRLVGFEA
jgi:hypothetical protein